VIPKIVHLTAPTKNLSWEERRMSRRLKSVLNDWYYALWDDRENDQLVANCFPHFLEQYRSIRRGVVRADIARCMYLYIHGGFYFDTDYKLLAPIGNEILTHSCVLPISRGGLDDLSTFRLGNAVMGSVAGHPFWADFLDDLFSNRSLATLPEDQIEKTTGPEGLTHFFVTNRDRYRDVHLAPRPLFHPRLTKGNFSYEKYTGTIGAHLCWGSWRTKHVLRFARNICMRKITAL